MSRGLGGRVAASSLLCALGLLLVGSSPASANPYAAGDVFAGIGLGRVAHYSPNGTLIELLDTGTGITDPPGNETGMCFDSANNLYTTNYDAYDMTKFDNKGGVFQNPWGRTFAHPPESCATDSATNNVYIGTAEANNILYKRNEEGTQLATYTLAVDQWAIDWIDLAQDRCTIFYTSEGALIKRFNVCTNTQLSNFADLGNRLSPCYQVRIRSNGEVLVACDKEIERLSSAGSVVQSYNPGNEGDFFTLALDPDGTSFWVAGYTSGRIYRVSIASGAVLTQFTATPAPTAGLSGLAVVGPMSSYSRPVGASPIRISFAPAFQPCNSASANASHNGPLSGQSCNPPVPTSSLVAVGPKSLGFARLIVLGQGQCAPFDSTHCYPDVTIRANVTDVRSGSPSGGDYNSPPTRNLTLTATLPGASQGSGLRITDKYNKLNSGTTYDQAGTVAPLSFPIPVSCTPTTDTAIGSTCDAATTANTLFPGAVVAGNRAIWEIGQLQLLDPGANGVPGDSDDKAFETEGVFVP